MGFSLFFPWITFASVSSVRKISQDGIVETTTSPELTAMLTAIPTNCKFSMNEPPRSYRWNELCTVACLLGHSEVTMIYGL